MSNLFNVFLLNLVFLSGYLQSEAVLLNPSILDKLNFEIEDSELNEFENLPRPRRSNPNPPVERVAKATYEIMNDDPFVLLESWNSRSPTRGSRLGGVKATPRDYPSFGTPKELSEWRNVPLDVSRVAVKFKKWNLVDGPTALSSSDSFHRPVRYLDYTNSQMPFNEGKVRHKSCQTKTPEVPGGADNSSFENSGRQKRSGKSTKRRRFFESPRRSRNLEIPRDDPLLEYSRVRRFLDHKRAKKHIQMTPTLEAKEAAMSRELDPNLNLEGILEPHVRKRRGLHTKKRDLSFKSRYT